MKRGRRMRPEEAALWEKVSTTATPLKGRPAQVSNAFDPASIEMTKPKTTKPAAQTVFSTQPPRKVDSIGHDLKGTLSDQLSKAPLRMDQKTFGHMKRGRLRPEARIDLHGMTLNRAHPALTQFILSEHARGRRLVLVITGKGKSGDDGGPIPVQHGVLRHQVPTWLSMAPLSSVVLQVAPAHPKHGGAGAYYVYLRRNRA